MRMFLMLITHDSTNIIRLMDIFIILKIYCAYNTVSESVTCDWRYFTSLETTKSVSLSILDDFLPLIKHNSLLFVLNLCNPINFF